MATFKEISEQITKGNWKIVHATYRNEKGEGVRGVDIVIEDWNKRPSPFKNWIIGITPQNTLGVHNNSAEFTDTCIANAEAICNAINGTYGKGIDPTTIGDEIKALREGNEKLKTDIYNIKSILR